jgi:hypothetical protein
MRRLLLVIPLLACAAEPVPVISDVDLQPLVAQARRVAEASDYLGEPFGSAENETLAAAATESDRNSAVSKVQRLLDPRVLFVVTISPEMRVKVAQGPAKPVLVENGWRQFLVKVINEAGTTAPLAIVSPNARARHNAGKGTPSDAQYGKTPKLPDLDLWLDVQTFDKQPLTPSLSGLGVEYRIVQLYARDPGNREARFSFNVGQGTQDLGFRSESDVLFECLPAREITLRVKDEHGQPTTASFLARDRAERVYPSQARRLAPDFAFHPQVYRADGESLRLPDGEYTLEFTRGPESIPEIRKVKVDGTTKEWEFQARRWIDPSTRGWWSGDHHIHAAGCAHYTNPTEGVHAPDMARHCRGEDLKVGANLTWGPCFDYQKRFFTGKEDGVSQWPYLLRYDVEVSGFGSHKSGHLCLLRLKEQMYPGGDSSAHWPTLGLSTLRWAKKQGAVCGPAHSGWGLRFPDQALPSYSVPPFDGIGACEYIVDITHEVEGPDGKLVPAVDFVSTVDTPATWELNIWYHTLNAGFRPRISGETDFPCIYGERVGLGRSYVKLDGKLAYDDWCEGIRLGRAYVSDGYSHLMDFRAGEVAVGENGSELKLASAGKVKLSALVAARLNERPNPKLRGIGGISGPFGSPADKPFWHLERARIQGTREVPVEAIVNGVSVAQQRIVADGTQREIAFEVPIEHSSWVALRILPSSHTNPVFVQVGERPLRMKKSLEWCAAAVDACWKQKERTYAEAERGEARAAYEHARTVYRARLAEAVD